MTSNYLYKELFLIFLGELPTLDRTQLTPVSSVRSLGMILGSTLSMEAEITNVACLAFFHLRQAQQRAPYLSTPNLAMVVHASWEGRAIKINFYSILLTMCPPWGLIKDPCSHILHHL